MDEKTTQLMLHIDPGPEADVKELAELSQQLRDELLELNLETVDFMRAGEIPEKAKVGDPVTWGTLLLTLAASGGVLTTLINAIQSWLTRQDRRSVTLEIGGDKLVVTGISSEDQKRLVDAWVNRLKGS